MLEGFSKKKGSKKPDRLEGSFQTDNLLTAGIVETVEMEHGSHSYLDIFTD